MDEMERLSGYGRVDFTFEREIRLFHTSMIDFNRPIPHIRKEEQRRKGRLLTYASNDTHKNRQVGGKSRPLPRPIPAPQERVRVELERSEMSSTSRELPIRDSRDPRDLRNSGDTRDLRDTRGSGLGGDMR